MLTLLPKRLLMDPQQRYNHLTYAHQHIGLNLKKLAMLLTLTLTLMLSVTLMLTVLTVCVNPSFNIYGTSAHDNVLHKYHNLLIRFRGEMINWLFSDFNCLLECRNILPIDTKFKTTDLNQ